jgi:hypothetical protein
MSFHNCFFEKLIFKQPTQLINNIKNPTVRKPDISINRRIFRRQPSLPPAEGVVAACPAAPAARRRRRRPRRIRQLLGSIS